MAPGPSGTMVVQWWYNGATMVLQWWYNGATMVLQWSEFINHMTFRASMQNHVIYMLDHMMQLVT